MRKKKKTEHILREGEKIKISKKKMKYCQNRLTT